MIRFVTPTRVEKGTYVVLEMFYSCISNVEDQELIPQNENKVSGCCSLKLVYLVIAKIERVVVDLVLRWDGFRCERNWENRLLDSG